LHLWRLGLAERVYLRVCLEDRWSLLRHLEAGLVVHLAIKVVIDLTVVKLLLQADHVLLLVQHSLGSLRRLGDLDERICSIRQLDVQELLHRAQPPEGKREGR